MVVADACTTIDRVYLLLVSVLLHALLLIVHNGYHVLHLLSQSSEDVGFVVHLIYIASEGGVNVEVAKLVVVEGEDFGVECAVLEHAFL